LNSGLLPAALLLIAIRKR
jgi:hypothetical protein